MKTYRQPSGISQGLDFLISTDWTPAQAFAVVELIDDLRDRIYSHYEVALFEQMREELGIDESANMESTDRRDDSGEPF
jgi:hypothetical protein